ncbi:GntR family transcriptional regulator [Chroococcidiopsis sp. CCALA 051]|uniref:aminotransferase-like domain-containing protein n=1 Tax=Chroococcidiopsis sp. CCALA 051 TaxID=869949 RepID=UPI000D0D1D83|nr:PLP-dependent aminotransferase family protein [Chroococcidiopsis sp. CCALA 051]MBE9015814.1 PLP-dependent aminotransferase family protein [Chroococcidiopsidales cyanobacterium LEGE 13417]PSM49053.1 GntR family transcriptional regulator [Chroococcidiopsis sp. CCALA 051]
MRIPIERHSSTAVYLQICDRIRHLIETGALRSGDKLPSIRTLSASTRVNKLTVIEAYNVLAAEGLVEARQGSGYFVCPAKIDRVESKHQFAPPQDTIVLEQPPLPPRIEEFQGGSSFNLYMKSVQARQQPGTIDLSSGFSLASGLDDLPRVARRAVKQISGSLFNYDLPQGQFVLRQQIARLLVQQHGLNVTADNLIITNGSKQGILLAVHHYVKPGDWVLVESPTWYGMLSLLYNMGARVIGIPMTPEGINLELLEKNLYTYRPKLIFTVSTLHNPTGLTTSLDHRRQLLALAEKYDCIVLEDNAYEGLNFEPVPVPIKALDTTDRVIYAGTFSKTIMPGIRVGYLVVTGEDYQPLVERKLHYDIHVSTVSQAIVSEYLASGHYRHHLAHLQAVHLQSRNAMLSAMQRHYPPATYWTIPKGGTFLWVQMPAHLPLAEICQKALARGVFVAEGTPFFPGGQQSYPALRLNFTLLPEQIEQGIAILGEILQKYV